MISIFDSAKLKALLKDFYQLTNIRITIFNDNLVEFVSYPDEIPDFCKIIRSCPEGRKRCADCDRNACEKASRERGAIIYQCHSGLTEAVTPLIVKDVLVGYLFLGHIFNYGSYDEGWENIRARCGDMPIDLGLLQKEIFKHPIISNDYVSSAAHILLAVANYLVMEKMAVLQENTLEMRLDKYIDDHFTEKISVELLCRNFGIGKTQLYKMADRLYGCGIIEHIRSLRITLAKKLMLENNDISLAEISSKCGYSDYNYFINVFSKVVGCGPGEWRRQHC